jgi:fucose permease
VIAAFTLAGIATTMLGPLMPRFQARWHIGDAPAGLLFMAQFLLSVLSAAAVGPLSRRYGYRRVVASGLLLIAAGATGCAVAPWPLVLAAVAAYGCGLGLVIPAGNLATPSARNVMLLNLAWCAGAVLAPILIAILGKFFLWALASAALASAVQVQYMQDLPVPRPQPPRRGTAPLTAAFLFLYVGTETSIAGWVSAYAVRTPAASSLWAAIPTVFWLAMLLGRATAPALLKRVRPQVLLRASLLCAFAGACLLIGTRWQLPAGALSGLGLAAVFPLVVSEYADTGLVFSAAGCGGAVLPPLVGFISQSTGSLRLAMSSVLIWLAAMAWLQLRLARSLTKAKG